MFFRQRNDSPGKSGKCFVFPPQTADRFILSSIESGRNQYKLRTKFIESRTGSFVPLGNRKISSRSTWKRNIQRRSNSRTRSMIISRSGVRIASLFMKRKGKNIGVFVENRFRAISVVNIPVDDCDSLHIVIFSQIISGDCDVVEDAKTHS